MASRFLKTLRLVLSSLLLWSLCASCSAGSATTPARPVLPASWHSALSLTFAPSYLTAVASDEDVVIYLESSRDDRLTSYGVAFTPYGERATAIVTLVEEFSAPFGEVVLASRMLLVPVIKQAYESTAGAPVGPGSLEIWAWRPRDEPVRLLSCVVPTVGHGQVFEDNDELFVLFEDLDGNLWGFKTLLDEPSCPHETDRTLIAAAPLPNRYRLDWLNGRFALSGQSGESYSILLFGRDFEAQQRLRLASRAAPDPADLRVFNLDDGNSVAIYGARAEGARDIYVASLSQLSVGPLSASRIVASADAERTPRLYQVGDQVVVSWSARDETSREHLEIAAMVPELGSFRSGGELLWRHSIELAPTYASVWTRGGLLRVWVDVTDHSSTLIASPYRPSFWR